MTKATVTLNEEKNGIEIAFDERPSAEVRFALIDAGFRWHNARRIWFAKNTEERRQIADNITMTTRPALEIAGKISREYGAGKKLREDSAEEAARKLDAIRETLPSAEAVDGGGLYDGWRGGNNSKWRTDAELKKCLQEDFKRAGIRATFRFPRCGYLTSLYVTITMPMPRAEAFKPFEEWRDDFTIQGSGWYSYTDDDGKLRDIWAANYYALPDEERERMRDNIERTVYELTQKHAADADTYSPGERKIWSESAAAILKTARAIVESYNKDCSNSMIDYFDRDIYDHYGVKFTA